MWWEDCKGKAEQGGGGNIETGAWWQDAGGKMEDRYWGRRKSGHGWDDGLARGLTMMEVFYSNSVFVYFVIKMLERWLTVARSSFHTFEIIFVAVNSPKQPPQLYQVRSGVGFTFQPRTLPWWLMWRCFTAASKLNSRETFHSLKGSAWRWSLVKVRELFTSLNYLLFRVSNWDTETLIITTNSPYIWQGKNPTSKRENLDNHTTPPQQHTATVGRKNSL